MNRTKNSREKNALEPKIPTGIERLTAWVGSPSSLALHTISFAACAAIGILGFASWAGILLVVTTIVSLEAIYLAIFIQMTVNEHARELEQVSEDVEDISEDVEGIQEDIEEISEDEKSGVEGHAQEVMLAQLAKDMQRVLSDLEIIKKEAAEKQKENVESA